MVIGGHRRTLRGRVAWIRSGGPGGHRTAPSSGSDTARGAGAGIEFIELGPRDADLLRGLVEPTDHEQQPVDVWFEGMKAPIKSHAVVRGDSLQISTRLPFLRLSSPLKVSFKHLGVEESRIGTLDSITLDPAAEDGVPILCLNVSTPIADSAQGTIEVQDPRKDTPPEGLLLSEPSTVVDPDVARPTPPPPPPVPLVRVKGEAAPPAVAFTRVPVAATADRTQRVVLPAPEPSQPREQSPRPHPWRAAVGGFALGALLIVAAGALQGRVGRPAGSTTGPQRGLAPMAVAAPAPASAATTSAPPPSAAPPAAAEAPSAATPAPGAPAAAARAERPIIQSLPGGSPEAAPLTSHAPAEAAELAIEGPAGARLDAHFDGLLTTVSIPLSGSGRGASRYKLADPPGVGLHLPRARLRLATGIYKLGAGPLRQLWLRGRGNGSNVRAYFDPSAASAELRVEGGSLKLVVRGR
jgi:hypothetical protein